MPTLSSVAADGTSFRCILTIRLPRASEFPGARERTAATQSSPALAPSSTLPGAATTTRPVPYEVLAVSGLCPYKVPRLVGSDDLRSSEE
jgi:hypothetical protein